MIQFTPKECLALREKAKSRPDIIEKLKAQTREIMERQVLVPQNGIANWKLYYYCPDCSVKLHFDWERPKEHVCPTCGKVLRGEPYDSTWWGMVNERNRAGVDGLSLLYLLGGEEKYADRAIEILLAYADCYQNYAVHGDIPCNKPGRIGAQAIDEAIIVRSFAVALDRIGDRVNEKQMRHIREDLLLPSARFLMGQRTEQLHNHEVIISAAIASIGILFDQREMIDFALHTPYGLVYQLDHGVLEDGMWFEDCFSYLFFALESFFAYEQFAMHTAYALIRHPGYQRMLDLAWAEMLPWGSFPRLGDCKLDHYDSAVDLFEFAWSRLGDSRLLSVLERWYADHPRDRLTAFLYGAEIPEEGKTGENPTDLIPQVGHSGQSLLRGEGASALLLRSDVYGGEHDHHDRLGLIWQYRGKDILPDLGTTGYGARLHYAYYKNTATHNVVCINGRNQPPANAVVKRNETYKGLRVIEAVCDFRKPSQVDSHAEVEWDSETYRQVVLTRRIAFSGTWFAEVFLVRGAPEGANIDWIAHFAGTRGPCVRGGEKKEPLLPPSADGASPYAYLTDVRAYEADVAPCTRMVCDGTDVTVYAAPFQGTVFDAVGPDNPSDRKLPYLIERVHGERAVFAHVMDPTGTVKAAGFVWDEKKGQMEILLRFSEGQGEVVKVLL